MRHLSPKSAVRTFDCTVGVCRMFQSQSYGAEPGEPYLARLVDLPLCWSEPRKGRGSPPR